MVKVANSKDIAQQIDKAIEEQLRIIFNEIVFRVFEQGKKATGDLIGNGKYSQRPTLIDTDPFTQKVFKVKGKRVAQKTKTGEYLFFGGYKSFKEAVNVKTNVVNLTLTGTLRNSMFLQKIGGVWFIGFPSSQAEKLRSITSRYGLGIFELTDEQKSRINQAVINVLRKNGLSS